MYDDHKKSFGNSRLFLILVTVIIMIVLLDPLFLQIPFEQDTFAKKKVKQQQQRQQSSSSSSPSLSSSCIIYDSFTRLIRISCSSATLTDIYKQMGDDNLIHKEEKSSDAGSTNATGDSNANIWSLNAGLLIDRGAALYINSTDTKWLKILANGTNGYAIDVSGTLKIDSVKITSWNPSTNDYFKFKPEILPGRELEESGIDAVPRPYILVEEGSTGTTDITNSELAYLGYACGGGCSGLTYYGGAGSIVKANNIHNDRFGFYSKGASELLLENNEVHHNFMYGFDPHTGTHDIEIRNNTVHDNGAMGIICSLNCYNVTIENNEVYNSQGSGIMFSRNMTNSVVRNNIVHNEDNCILVSQSHNDEVYGNRLTSCQTAVKLFHNSSGNMVHDNIISNSVKDISMDSVGPGNRVYSNKVVNPAIANDSTVEQETNPILGDSTTANQ